MNASKKLGQIVITFSENVEPEFEFKGEIPMLSMYALPYQLSTAFMYYLDKQGDELRKKLESKGLEIPEAKQEIVSPVIIKQN